jgi:hypothetical protein
MTHDLCELPETASAFVLHLPAAEIASRKAEIERVLSDDDFFIKEAARPS